MTYYNVIIEYLDVEQKSNFSYYRTKSNDIIELQQNIIESNPNLKRVIIGDVSDYNVIWKDTDQYWRIFDPYIEIASTLSRNYTLDLRN